MCLWWEGEEFDAPPPPLPHSFRQLIQKLFSITVLRRSFTIKEGPAYGVSIPESVGKVLRAVAAIDFAIESKPLLFSAGALYFVLCAVKTVYNYGHR